MRRGSAIRRVAGWTAVAGIAAAGAVAASPPVTVHPKHLPFTLALPPGWKVTALAPGDSFDAASPTADAHLAVTVGLNAGTFKSFVAAETAAARKHYRSEDPGATLTAHTVDLPAGRALEISALLNTGLAVYLFDFQHDGAVYHFTFYTSQSLAASRRPTFERSARSITFTKR